MISINPLLPPVPAPADLAALGALVKFVSEMIANPKKGKELVDEYLAGAVEYQQAYERELGLRRQAVAERAEFERTSTRQRKEMEIALETERDVVAKEHAQRRVAIERDEQDVMKRIAAVEAREQSVTARERELEARLRKIQQAVAA